MGDAVSRVAAVLLLSVLCVARAAAAVPLEIQGERVELSLFSLFLLPGETVLVPVLAEGALALDTATTVQQDLSDGHWQLTAPQQPGIYPTGISLGAEHTALNLVVLRPAAEAREGWLQGYRIGNYPTPPERRKPAYLAPRGFVEVTADNRGTRLSPHFTLEQFLCKQQSDYPKFVVVREKLLLLLEDLLAEVNRQGYAAQTFGFISAYRTPWYNASIGNVAFSRHLYGDAADIYVDLDGDGRLDDLNADGRRNRADVERLFKLFESYKTQRADRDYAGGIGLYQGTSRHGGFVHVDTRGYRARW